MVTVIANVRGVCFLSHIYVLETGRDRKRTEDRVESHFSLLLLSLAFESR